MALINQTDKFKLPFESEHPEPYALSGNRILIISENWEYIIRDGLNQKTIFEGTLPEDKSHSTICSIYSYFFFELSYSKIVYYSRTNNTFKFYNFETKSVEKEVKNHFKIEKDFEFFMFLEYKEETQRFYLVHMKEFSKCSIETCSEKNTADVLTIAEFELSNPNCIYYDRRILYFGTQTSEQSPIRMHFLKDGLYFSLDFSHNENIQILDAGFYQSDIIYILYNHNEIPESGTFFISKELDPKIENIVVDCKDECVQKVVFCDENSPDILDGRIIVDKLLNSITVTGMDSIRRYHISKVNEKFVAKLLSQKDIQQSIDYVPLNRESLTSFDFEEEQLQVTIMFYRATDTRCLYYWLFEKSGLSNELNITDLNDLCELLI